MTTATSKTWQSKLQFEDEIVSQIVIRNCEWRVSYQLSYQFKSFPFRYKFIILIAEIVSYSTLASKMSSMKTLSTKDEVVLNLFYFWFTHLLLIIPLENNLFLHYFSNSFSRDDRIKQWFTCIDFLWQTSRTKQDRIFSKNK